MKRDVIPYTVREAWLEARLQDVTSTEVSALFNLSPYQTLYELWHRKKHKTLVEFEVNERMKWGTRLQDAIAHGIAEDECGWNIRKMEDYMRLPDLRMGSSFDFFVDITGEQELISSGILEIKNVDGMAFKDGWVVEDEKVEAPPHIEIQVQHQLAVSGKQFAYIGALIGGNRKVLLRREPDSSIITAIHERVAQFWSTIEMGQEPSPDFTRDAEFIAKLYNYAEPGKVINDPVPAIGELVEKYKAFGQTEKEAAEAKQAVKAQLLTIIGEAEKVIGNQFSISAGMIGPTRVEYDRKGYRDFRVFTKKGSSK